MCDFKKQYENWNKETLIKELIETKSERTKLDRYNTDLEKKNKKLKEYISDLEVLIFNCHHHLHREQGFTGYHCYLETKSQCEKIISKVSRRGDKEEE